MTARVPAALVALAVCVALAACTPTTYDGSDESVAPTVPTTTLPISNDPVEVLPLLLSEVRDLSRRVAERDGSGAAATRIEELWAAIEQTVTDERPELVGDFDFVVRRCRAAADRNRPADADRAYKNLESLVESYLAI